MENKREIRWLQLSEWNMIDSDELISLGSKLCEEFSQSIDFAVITGDLSDTGLQYKNANIFLNQLAEGIEKEKIIIVPGDKDVVTSGEREDKIDQEKIIKRMDDNALKYNQEVFLKKSERLSLYRRFLRYVSFCKKFYGNAVDLETETNYINERIDNISLLCINTAFASNENHAKEQFIDKNGLDEVVNERKVPCIAIMHHDYYEIAEVQREYFKMKLEELGVNVILCGHKLPNSLDYVTLEKNSPIPIFTCSYFGSKSDGVRNCFKMLEYRWKTKKDIVLINGYEWNFDTLVFKQIGKGKFCFGNKKPLPSLNGKSEKKSKDFGRSKRNSFQKCVIYLKGIFIIAASALITILLLVLFLWEKRELPASYKGIVSNGEVIFENKDVISDAWIHTVGQIVVITKDGTVIKTYILDGLYEKSKEFHDAKEFTIKRLECPLADSCVKALSSVLEQLLEQEGYDKHEIMVKEIGLVAISLPTDLAGRWLPYYYILDDDSLSSIDEKVAISKMSGGQLTDENWGDMGERDKIIAEFKECVLHKLKNE